MKVNEQDHRALALWAADCSERVIGYFNQSSPNDNRPRQAIEASRAWARGEIKVGPARSASVAAHAAARQAEEESARAAARSAGHAVATAHMFQHARHAADYALKAISYAEGNANKTDRERDWQIQHLPLHLVAVVFPEMKRA